MTQQNHNQGEEAGIKKEKIKVVQSLESGRWIAFSDEFPELTAEGDTEEEVRQRFTRGLAIKNSPSWEQIVHTWSIDTYPIYPIGKDVFTHSEVVELKRKALETGATLAKDYYEKEVVEPLRTDVKLLKLALLKTDYRQDLEEENNSLKQMQIRLDSELESLQEENERLKDENETLKVRMEEKEAELQRAFDHMEGFKGISG